MKIENIEKACKLNKELKEIEEILRLKCYTDRMLSVFFVLFHDNERYNINSLLSEAAKTKIMNIIFDDCGERAKQIKQEIEEL